MSIGFFKCKFCHAVAPEGHHACGDEYTEEEEKLAALRADAEAYLRDVQSRLDAVQDRQYALAWKAGYEKERASNVASRERANIEEDTVPRSRYDACNRDWLIEKDRADGIAARAAAHIQMLEAEPAALRVRLAECEKDARRYRWLRDAPARMWKRLAEETVEATESAIDAALASQVTATTTLPDRVSATPSQEGAGSAVSVAALASQGSGEKP